MTKPVRVFLLLGIVGLLGVGTWAAAGHSSWAEELEEVHHKADLNGMLEKIGKNNDRLGASNQSILGNLQAINQKSLVTKDIHGKLNNVRSGLGGQNSTLTDIEKVTGQQVGLSKNLNSLSIFLEGKMSVINGSTESQISQVGNLRSITLDTRKKMKSVLNENVTLEKKLRSAAEKSKRAEQSMP
ncbi:hypothetical protein C8P63_1085 [Melghirimyces profundicolus]|uniref:Uncharacterized protein n=1 Tax=Melghirimyces profundicolus TaxID=1242148 RepID=A0A2T6BXD6_9BACL|nr:hypothetical protein [Melghirimyces profundicolus]PTX60696.1 hypothetical protein C8P63_1085 [Melghirimyces profundicolus]